MSYNMDAISGRQIWSDDENGIAMDDRGNIYQNFGGVVIGSNGKNYLDFGDGNYWGGGGFHMFGDDDD